MKRDMELVRTILLESSSSFEWLDAQYFVTDQYSFEFVCYHIDIMRDAGLIEATITKAFGGQIVTAQVQQLTWYGQDFLDTVRSETVWKQVSQTIASTVGTTSIDVVKALAVKVASQMLGC